MTHEQEKADDHASMTLGAYLEFRAMLTQLEPSHHHFAWIVEACASPQWANARAQQDVLLTEALTALMGWPATQRALPTSLLRRVVCPRTSTPELCLVRALEAWRWPLRDEEFRRLLRHPGLAALELLDLSRVKLAARGVGLLWFAPHLVGVRTLRLRFNQLTSDHLEPLTRAASLGQVRVLDLARNLLDDEAIEHLIAWPGFKRLVRLDLTDNAITTRGLDRLIEAVRRRGVTMACEMNENPIPPSQLARIGAPGAVLRRPHVDPMLRQRARALQADRS